MSRRSTTLTRYRCAGRQQRANKPPCIAHPCSSTSGGPTPTVSTCKSDYAERSRCARLKRCQQCIDIECPECAWADNDMQPRCAPQVPSADGWRYPQLSFEQLLRQRDRKWRRSRRRATAESRFPMGNAPRRAAAPAPEPRDDEAEQTLASRPSSRMIARVARSASAKAMAPPSCDIGARAFDQVLSMTAGCAATNAPATPAALLSVPMRATRTRPARKASAGERPSPSTPKPCASSTTSHASCASASSSSRGSGARSPSMLNTASVAISLRLARLAVSRAFECREVGMR